MISRILWMIGLDRDDAHILPVMLTVFADVIALAAILPILPAYARQAGASPWIFGTLVSSYSLSQLIGSPVLGALSDRIGRKPLMILTFGVSGASYLLLGLSHSLGMLFASRILAGLMGGNVSLSFAYLADHTTPARRPEIFGKLQISIGLGYIVGPLLTSLSHRRNEHLPAWIAAATCFIGMLAAWALLRPSSPRGAGRVPRASFLRTGAGGLERRSLALLGVLFTVYLAMASYLQTFALFSFHRYAWKGHPFGPPEVAVVLAYAGSLAILVQIFVLPRLLRRVAPARICLLGFVLAACGYLAFTLSPSVLVLLIAPVLVHGSFGLLRPCLSGLLSSSVSESLQGTTMGFHQSANSLANIVGPLLAGATIQQNWLNLWGAIPAAACLFGLGAFLIQLKSRDSITIPAT